MSKLYNCLPSVLMNIEDSYTAFCFNEACALIRLKIDSGETPVYQEMNKTKQNNYSNFEDFYKQYE